ncbi:Flp pilus assembly protein TadG [Arthrobacter sp. GAS37]
MREKERGAVAVMVALLMVVLLGFAAIAVDEGML